VNRKLIFTQKVKEIIEHNSQSSKTFTKGINGFSDFTNDEFYAYMNIPSEP